MGVNTELEQLKKVQLFHNITEKQLSEFIPCLQAQTKIYKKDQYIFMEGDPATKVGILLSGSVTLLQEDYYGNRNIFTTIKELEMFAASFAFAGIERYPVSAIADRESKVMWIECFRITHPCSKACIHHSQLIHNILQITAQRNMELKQKIECAFKKTTKEKVMAYLMNEAKKAGSDCFEIPYDRQKLADYLGVERSAMSAEIGKLQKEGWIKANKKHFQILKKKLQEEPE